MLKTGLAILFRAYRCARDLKVDPREFAVSQDSLYRAGLTPIDIHWLLARGLVEITSLSIGSEGTIKSQQLHCNECVGLILTNTGVIFADQLSQKPNHTSLSSVLPLNGQTPASNLFEVQHTKQKPHWDRDRKGLYFCGLLIKQFRWSAVNQETILMAFEEDDWPARIDDPLPQRLNQDPKQRLHDTVKCLNRNHKKRSIRFTGDGTGEGVRWLLVDSSS